MSDPRYRKKALEVDQIGVLVESKCENFWAPREMIMPGQSIEVGKEIDFDPKAFDIKKNEDGALPALLLYVDSGDAIFQEEVALAEMLKAEVLFANQAESPETVCLYVNCNDVFAWGCSDAEDLPLSEIERLWRHWQHDKAFGAEVWCMRQRGRAPQAAVARDIRQAGVWDLDALGLRSSPYGKGDAA